MAIKRLFAKDQVHALTTSQDAGKDWAITKSGYKRARLVVNRATGIGDEGIHSTPAKLNATRDGHNKVYSFGDEVSFEIIKVDKKVKNIKDIKL